jgi:hypothetical protein
MKYLFEKYVTNERGRVFLGYEAVVSDSTENARLSVLNKVGQDITLAQVYVPQEDN